jgi:hypothetical protein
VGVVEEVRRLSLELGNLVMFIFFIVLIVIHLHLLIVQMVDFFLLEEVVVAYFWFFILMKEAVELELIYYDGLRLEEVVEVHFPLYF